MANSAPPQSQRRSPLAGFLPFFWLALACLGGILLADLVAIPSWAWLTGAALSLAALVGAGRLPGQLALTHHLRRLTRLNRRLPRALLVMVFFLGGWRYDTRWPMVILEYTVYLND